MSQKQLSPKQYITTKARSLPIAKCLINPNWKSVKFANIMVMRRHVNGNITMGAYLIDLLCLGVKDVIYHFNISEEQANEMSEIDDFEEIDYELAHNIIYAGHDFAKNFHIEPHKDFSVAKFILEQDDDQVPLIEIETGDQDGLPFLMVHNAGEYLDALAKLKKYAGEGNYKYLIGEEAFENDDYDDDYDDDDYDDDDDDDLIQMNDFAPGEIDALRARELDFEADTVGQIKDRTIVERMAILTEFYARAIREKHEDFFAGTNPVFDKLYDIIELEVMISGSTEEQEIAWNEQEEKLSDLLGFDERIKAHKKSLDKFAENPFAFFYMYVDCVLQKDFDKPAGVLASKLLKVVEKQAKIYPLAALMIQFDKISELAKRMVDKDITPDKLSSELKAFDFFYEHELLTDAYPGRSDWGVMDIHFFALIQAILYTLKNDEKRAFCYYDLAVDAIEISAMLTICQTILLAKFAEQIHP